MPRADVSLHVVNLVRLRVDLVPPLEAVVVEVLRHLLFVLVQQRAEKIRNVGDSTHNQHNSNVAPNKIYSASVSLTDTRRVNFRYDDN